MARLAAGERRALWELHDLARDDLARMVRAAARRIDVRITAEDVVDLTIDAAIELADLAPAWRPDGALPWVWARHRISALVHAHAGTFAAPLDEAHLVLEAPPVPERIEDPQAVLRAAAARHPGARRLERRLREAVSDRDAAIWLGVQIERGTGNRSPAVTVATDHGMRPEAVRKVVQRVGDKLERVA